MNDNHTCVFHPPGEIGKHASDHLSTANRLALCLGSLMWMMQIMSFNRLEAEGESLENVCAMVNHYAELARLLTDEIGHHVETAQALLTEKGGRR